MSSPSSKTITVSNASAAVENEPLARPFGFKGGYLTELWQSAVKLESNEVCLLLDWELKVYFGQTPEFFPLILKPKETP